MRNVIVTGADGFIGKSLTCFLLEKGYRVYSIVLDGSNVVQRENEQIIELNMKDIFRLKEFIPPQTEVLFHLAWEGVSSADKDDYKCQLKNVQYSADCLLAAKEAGVKKVVGVGSTSEYAYCREKINGQNVPAPSDAYAASKVAAHYMMDLLSKKYGQPFIWILLPSVYGPGRDDDNLITYAINELLKGNRPRFTKLEQIWEYIYINDVAKAMMAVGERGISGKCYVLGKGEAKALSYYVEQIHQAIDNKAELGIGELPYKTSQIDNCIIDSSELVKDTGFCDYISFEEGIKLTIDYWKQRIKG